MTEAELIDRLSVAIDRDDLGSAKYLEYANEAIRHIATLHSFDEMKATESLTISSGQQEVVLNSKFKELQNGRFPVLLTISGTVTNKPIPAYAREEIEHLPTTLRPTYYLTLILDGNAPKLRAPALTAADWVLTVYEYQIPAYLTNAAGTNEDVSPLLNAYPNMVIEKALSVGFQSINDPAWQEHEMAFRAEFQLQTGEDIRVSIPGYHRERQ